MTREKNADCRKNFMEVRAMQYAKPHCHAMANQVHLALFISRLMAPIAAKHGAQSRLNTRKEKPVILVKCWARVCQTVASPPP